MKLLLIRHGEMAGDPYDTPSRPVRGCLSAKGLRQAGLLRYTLAKEHIDLAVCSVYGRAIQTAEEALKGRDIPFLIKDFLKEWLPEPEVRKATSTEFEQICKQYDHLPAESTWKTDMGEGVFDMYARIVPPFVEMMAELGVYARDGGYVIEKGAEDQTIAFFAHGGSLNVLLSYLLRLPPFPVGAFRFELTGVARVTFQAKAGVYYPSLGLLAPLGSPAVPAETFITESVSVNA